MQPGDVFAGRFALRFQAGLEVAGKHSYCEREVWRARHLALDKVVTLELYRLELEGQTSLEQLRRFADASAPPRIETPYIVPILEVGASGGWFFAVMEALEGETLRQRLDRDHQISPSETLRIAAHLGVALSHLHQAGMEYARLSPRSVLLERGSERCRLLLTDLAWMQSVCPQPGLCTVLPLCSGPYQSPEIARGSPSDRRSDTWSLAVLCYECLTGISPFVGENYNSTLANVLLRTRETALPATWRSIGLDPDMLEGWFEWATFPEHDRRFQSTQELVFGLSAALGESPPWVRWPPLSSLRAKPARELKRKLQVSGRAVLARLRGVLEAWRAR